MENEKIETIEPQTEPETLPEEPSHISQPLGAQLDVDAYQSIIEGQQGQIDALMAANKRLNDQIAQMVQSGAQITQAGVQAPVSQSPQPVQPVQNLNPQSLASDEDWSLESLGKEIGKR